MEGEKCFLNKLDEAKCLYGMGKRKDTSKGDLGILYSGDADDDDDGTLLLC
jgi:hypothetical protein